jgi:hypothetical protein
MKSVMSPSLQTPRPLAPAEPVGGRAANVTRGRGPRECQRPTAHAKQCAASEEVADGMLSAP